ncbi:MAG: tetratricopeptide repeat protein [Deltaproteobacteria bacterium]|nr:tetratricopeptide repeat protein [Deltaproteobacteria bacterium]
MRVKFVICIWLLVILGPAMARGEEDPATQFVQANQSAGRGQYAEAAEAYERLISMGYLNGRLFYNLGNCYLKQGHLGRAIVNYDRALIFMPRDADLAFNLKVALDQTKDEPPSPEWITTVSKMAFWYYSLAPGELYALFAGINILLFAVLAVRMWRRAEWIFWSGLVCLFLWLILGVSAGLKAYSLADSGTGVIIVKEATALSGKDEGSTALFKLHDGASVTVEQVDGAWAKVTFSEDKRGWTKLANLAQIKDFRRLDNDRRRPEEKKPKN